jgi:aminoglycoside phosphotransferase (APT) family kinase protein
MDDLAVSDAINRLIRHHTGGESYVTNLKRLTGGSSTENWSFDAKWTDGGVQFDEELILRRAPEHEIVSVARTNEFQLLQAVHSAGLRVPRAYWLDEEGRWLKRPAMILQKCSGSAERALLTEKGKAGLNRETRLELARQMVDYLANLHKLDVATLRLPGVTTEDPAQHELTLQERQLARYEAADVLELRLAAHWLSRHLPRAPARRVLVHGDFRPANMLVNDGLITTVLDWELAHIGDPAEDIGWYLARNYRSEHFIQGSWGPEEFLDRYEHLLGTTVDRQSVAFWSVFATFKLVCIAMAAISAFRAGDRARAAFMPSHLIAALMASISDAENIA